MTSDSSKPPRRALVRQNGTPAGYLESGAQGGWRFCYSADYHGEPISLTLPVREEPFDFPSFPAVFDGLLPEGPQLEALLRLHKIDRRDGFRQLVTVGRDLIGSLTVEEAD